MLITEAGSSDDWKAEGRGKTEQRDLPLVMFFVSHITMGTLIFTSKGFGLTPVLKE
jgi:hypothetical protein